MNITRRILALWAVAVPSICGFAQVESLSIFCEEYPRAGYFRIAESSIRAEYQNLPGGYRRWRDRFSDLSGIMGKTEYEELLKDNPYELIYNWFKKFKAEFPDKFVMVHMNGRGRIPNYKIEKFSPGHWLYFEGSDVSNSIPGADSRFFNDEAWLEVDDVSHFRMDNGAKFKTPDDITLVKRKPDGTFDWEHAEYVRLKEIEIEGSRILVQRAMFGSKALEFSGGSYYAAPHIMGGPWGKTANMVWYYNLSDKCPRDRNGNNCADLLVKEFSDNFKKGGRWETFDGVEFDVMTSIPTTGYHEKRKALGQRADVDLDGVQDDGIFDGVQTFGIGNFDFITRLRDAVGPGKIISADGRGDGCQRVGNGSFNGVEMEGVPEQRPYGFVTWSTSYNFLDFWKDRTCSPKFNYGAFRYNNPDKLSMDELLNCYRLAFSQSVFTDSFLLLGSWITPSAIPDIRAIFGLSEKESPIGWLGKPIGPVEKLCPADRVFDSIQAKVGSNSILSITESGVIVSPIKKEGDFSFRLDSIPYGKPITVEVTLEEKGTSDRYPAGYNRQLTIVPNGIQIRYMKMLAAIAEKPFTYRFYFCDSFDPMTDEFLSFDPEGTGKLDLEFVIADADLPVEVSKVHVSDAQEILLRRFEKGAVIANLSPKPYFSEEFNVTVPARDAVFIRQ